MQKTYIKDDLTKSVINLGHEQQLLIDYTFYEDLKENRLMDKYINKKYLNVIQGKQDDIVNYLDNEEFFKTKCKDNYHIYYFEEADHRFKKTRKLEKIVEIVKNIICD